MLDHLQSLLERLVCIHLFSKALHGEQLETVKLAVLRWSFQLNPVRILSEIKVSPNLQHNTMRFSRALACALLVLCNISFESHSASVQCPDAMHLHNGS